MVSQSHHCHQTMGTHADEYAQWRNTKTNTNPDPNSTKLNWPRDLDGKT